MITAHCVRCFACLEIGLGFCGTANKHLPPLLGFLAGEPSQRTSAHSDLADNYRLKGTTVDQRLKPKDRSPKRKEDRKT